MPWRENKGVANLNGFRRILLVAYGKKSLEEIFIKEWPWARNLFNPL